MTTYSITVVHYTVFSDIIWVISI